MYFYTYDVQRDYFYPPTTQFYIFTITTTTTTTSNILSRMVCVHSICSYVVYKKDRRTTYIYNKEFETCYTQLLTHFMSG